MSNLPRMIPVYNKKGHDDSVESGIKTMAGYLRLIGRKRFFGTLTIRFEEGCVVKMDQNTSLKLADLDSMLRSEADPN